ncbi:MAG: class I SAM-dependent methyltransferase [Hymenobacteraceae bacterium]|nr:class I SAM-dependent methyltransferase [Hymenobacteraceae bacterium]MDX5396408.1 class I SAM-dependent methyltransferase [Hymenobacteraceae bacterium]MDX5512470.1 class I SAM-dependent methyltransferase [Hymenobacteraceae bacterium]
MQYRLRTVKLHGVHSPFVFDLYNHVILHDGTYAAYLPIELRRDELLRNERSITVTDFGAGSKVSTSWNRQIKDIASNAAKPAPYAQLLFRLVNEFQPEVVLELGTSFGLTTAYLAAAQKNSTVYTFEGCPATAKIASDTFRKIELKNVVQVAGNLDTTLPETLQNLPKVDFVYFDGNHRYEPTLRYFKQCLEKAHENSVFVLDDIYWSAEMERAWKEISAMPEVSVALDLFQIGIVFFRKKQEKEYFTLKY